MLTPEMYLVGGVVLVIVSLLLIMVAMYVRGWFFLPDLKSELQPIFNQQPHRR
jgi:hypothetical protein